jgi:hypothetical protein
VWVMVKVMLADTHIRDVLCEGRSSAVKVTGG